jgi:predicted amidophosphoribosyltransferase
MSSPICIRCKRPLKKGEGRLVIAGNWTCPDCVYELEHDGPVKKAPPPVRRSRKWPQKETLFDVDAIESSRARRVEDAPERVTVKR